MITRERKIEESLKFFTRLTPFFQAITPNKHIFRSRKKEVVANNLSFFCHISDALSRNLNHTIFDRYFIDERQGAYLISNFPMCAVDY